MDLGKAGNAGAFLALLPNLHLKDCAVMSEGRVKRRTESCVGLPSCCHRPATICSGNAKKNIV